jgi:Flp pilus assembly protein TadG
VPDPRRSRGRRPDEGAAAVEFALVSVLFFTLIFGIIQYGYYFYQLNAAASAAREGARLAVVGVDDCVAFKTIVKRRSGPLNGPTTTVTLQYYNPAGTTVDSAPKVNDEVRVTVNFSPERFHFPFVPFFPTGSQHQQGRSVAEHIGTLAGGSGGGC